jgi:hypothetical protein
VLVDSLFSKALPFETGAESGQRVSCAARHSFLNEWWRIFRIQYSTLPMDGPVLVDSHFRRHCHLKRERSRSSACLTLLDTL